MPNLRGQLQAVLEPYPVSVRATVMAKEVTALLRTDYDSIIDSEVAVESLQELMREWSSGSR